MNRQDFLDWIRDAILARPLSSDHIEQVFVLARQQYGGDTVYIRSIPRSIIDPKTRARVERVTRRTLQNHGKRGIHA